VNEPGSQIVHCGTDTRMRGVLRPREAV
jgi:hypothetical protein